jgi:hypothetical protein
MRPGREPPAPARAPRADARALRRPAHDHSPPDGTESQLEFVTRPDLTARSPSAHRSLSPGSRALRRSPSTVEYTTREPGFMASTVSPDPRPSESGSARLIEWQHSPVPPRRCGSFESSSHAAGSFCIRRMHSRGSATTTRSASRPIRMTLGDPSPARA